MSPPRCGDRILGALMLLGSKQIQSSFLPLRSGEEIGRKGLKRASELTLVARKFEIRYVVAANHSCQDIKQVFVFHSAHRLERMRP